MYLLLRRHHRLLVCWRLLLAVRVHVIEERFSLRVAIVIARVEIELAPLVLVLSADLRLLPGTVTSLGPFAFARLALLFLVRLALLLSLLFALFLGLLFALPLLTVIAIVLLR